MICWMLKNFDDARMAYKKIFYNSLNQNIFVEDEKDFVLLAKDNRRTRLWRTYFDIPYNIDNDIQSLKYIDENIEKIISKDIFPCVVSIYLSNIFESINLMRISENIDFKDNVSENIDYHEITEIKTLFNKYNIVAEFFKSGVVIPINYEQFRIILSKMSYANFYKKRSKYILENDTFYMTLFKEKEKENG